MQLAQLIFHNLLSFVAIISFIVFIHEFGHFIVARLCGVKVDEFAIGFGSELFGFTDKKNTRWKFCIFPVGGYVKMYGDKNGASMPDLQAAQKMSAQEKKQSFIFKNVYQRMAIVSAGPVANFILTIFLFTFLFAKNGVNQVAPIIDQVLEKSAAEEVGLKKGDEILEVNERKISDFSDIQAITASSIGEELLFKIKRKEKIFTVKISPKIQETKDFFGSDVKMPMLGVSASTITHQDLNLLQSFVNGSKETYQISIAILKATGDLITGKRSVKELGGPVKIANYSGKTTSMGIETVIWFMAMISVNLGIMNLLPVPVLDGGHLFFYIIEAIFRKPIPEKIQQIGFQIGLALLLSLMIFTTINDVRQLF